MDEIIAERISSERDNGIGTRVSRPLPSTRPLVDALRFNHFKNDGKFDHIVKRNLVQDLFRCLSGYEDLWTDPNCPETGRHRFKAYDFHRVELVDEIFPFPRQFSVRELQLRQDEAHRARNGPNADGLERRRYGRKCGKIISKMGGFYQCKTCFRDSSAIICVPCFNHSDHEGHEVSFRINNLFAPVCDCGATDLYTDPKSFYCDDHPPSNAPPADISSFDPGASDSPDVSQDFKRALYDTFVLCMEYVIDTFSCAPPPDRYSKLPKDTKELKSNWGSKYTNMSNPAKSEEGPWSISIFSDDRHCEPELVRQMQHATGADYDDCHDWVRELDTLGRRVVMTSASPTVAFFLANMFQQIDVPVSLRHAHDTYQESVALTLLEWMTDLCECHVNGDPDLTTNIMTQVLREEKFTTPAGLDRIAPDLRKLVRDPEQSNSRMRIDWMWHIDSRLWKQAKLLTRTIYAKMMTIHPYTMHLMANRFAVHYVTLTQDYLATERDQDMTLHQFLAYSVASDGVALREACRINDSNQQGLLESMVEVLEAYYRHIPGDFRDRIPLDPIGPIDTAQREHNVRLIAHKAKKGIPLFIHLRGILEREAVAEYVGTSQKFVHRVGQFIDLFIGMQPQDHETENHINFEVDWYKPFGLMTELAKLMRQIGECYQRAPLSDICELLRYLVSRIINDIHLLTDVIDQAKTWHPVLKDNVISYLDEPTFPAGSTYRYIDREMHKLEGFSFHHYNHYLLAQVIDALAGEFCQPGSEVDFPKMLNMILASEEDVYDEFCKQGQQSSSTDQVETPPWNSVQVMDNTLLLIEQPLTTYVVSRHIRADRWRRNGSSIRYQLNAYVDTSRREFTADQEFYLLQAASLMLGPIRFGLVVRARWVAAEEDEPMTAKCLKTKLPDPPGAVIDMEDFLWFIIHLSTDTDRAMRKSIEEVTRREIIQLLAIKPMTFLDLSKRLSDRMTERVEVSKILKSVSDFRGPTESNAGTYFLKPELVPEINAFWRHYSRNERKEVLEQILKQTYESRSNQSIEFEDWFYVPRKPELPAEPKPFYNLNGILRSSITVNVLQVALGYCILMESDEPFHDAGMTKAEIPRFDQLLDITLHLATLALRAEPDAFVPNSLEVKGVRLDHMTCPTQCSLEDSLFQNLWYIEVSDNPVYKPFKSRVRYLTRHIRKMFSEEDRQRHDEITASRMKPPALAVGPVTTDKAAAAVARQKQVMAEFAKKQAAFAAQNMSFGEDEDGDEEMDDGGDEDHNAQGPCLVCQDPVTPAQPGGMLALFQPSRIIRETVIDEALFTPQSLEIPANLDCATRKLTYARNMDDRSANAQVLDSYPTANMRLGCYISVCGHYMHESCMEQYSDHTRIRHSHQLHRNQPENVVRYEYMCPLCKSVSNFILPIDFESTPVGTKGSFRVNEEDGRPLTLLEHVRRMSAEGLKHINDSTKIWQHHSDGGHVKAWFSDYNPPRSISSRETRIADMRGSNLMIDRFRHLFKSLVEQSADLRKDGKKSWYAPEHAVGYTISVLEIAQRGLARAPGQATVAEQLLDSSRKVVKKMFEELKLELDGVHGKSSNQAGLRVAIFARFLPDWYRASSLPTSLLLRDPLSIVIECAAIAPDVLHPVIIMAYYAELTRALISVSIILRKHLGFWKEYEIAMDPFEYDVGPFAEQAKARFANFAPTAIGMFRNATPYNDVEYVLKTVPDTLLSKFMYMYTLPFIRRAAIVFHCVHGCYPVSRPEDIITEGCEYDRLGSLLALPDPRVTLTDKANGIELPMVLRWLSQWASGGRQVTPPELPGPYELKFLPKYMDELVLRYGEDYCSKCARLPSVPGLCLFCGELVCIGGDCCADDELGECNLHMQICGASTGIFIDVKRCSLLVLFAGTGTFMNAPYLDEHGDPDAALIKRGHRLILNEQRYEDIRKGIWLNHAIPHLIARKLEGVSDPGGWAAL